MKVEIPKFTGISLVIPTCGGNIDNFNRTVESARSVCDDVVAVSTCLFEDDLQALKDTGATVVELPWNYTAIHGFGAMHNEGHAACKHDWIVLLGVSETIHSGHEKIRETLSLTDPRNIFECWHINDPHRWGRVYNRRVSAWSGGIHEEVKGGVICDTLFEMRDTPKTPFSDPFKTEAIKHLKGVLYNMRYKVLLDDPSSLGGTNEGWILFVRGAADSINAFLSDNADLVEAAKSGDRQAFLDGVRRRMDAEKPAVGVNFAPTGEPRTGNETIEEAA